MNYTTVEVVLENGMVRPSGSEKLPARARALLTVLDGPETGPARTCTELAERWKEIPRLAPAEANAFADDIEKARASLPPLTSAWD